MTNLHAAKPMMGRVSGVLRLGEFILTAHAQWELRRRGLEAELVRAVLAAPEQRIVVRAGREVWQSRHSPGPGQKRYLIRVVVDLDRVPPEIVTAYKTSRIERYWRPAG